MGLVTETWVRLGEEIDALCSCGVAADAGDGAIEGAVEGGGGGCDAVAAAGVLGVDAAAREDDDADGGGTTAAAAIAAYLIGGSTAGAAGLDGVICCKPAFRIVDIGCCAKLGFGGGFAILKKMNIQFQLCIWLCGDLPSTDASV
jgi:hypothetical protein